MDGGYVGTPAAGAFGALRREGGYEGRVRHNRTNWTEQEVLVATRLVTRVMQESDFGAQGHTSLAWLGMAGVMINARGTVVLIDPLLVAVRGVDGEVVSETGHRFRVPLPIEAERVPRVDAVLYTHEDGDHFARPTVETLERRCRPRFVAPRPVAAMLREYGVGAERIAQVIDDDVVKIGAAEVRVTPALHDWARPIGPIQRGDAVGYLVRTADGTIWHPGDTRLIPELERVRDVDVMMFDVAEVDAHLGPAGSARLAQTCGAKVLVAYHYGTYEMPAGSWGGCDPEDAREAVERAGVRERLRVVGPGEVMRVARSDY